jgi:hypothetical protein
VVTWQKQTQSQQSGRRGLIQSGSSGLFAAARKRGIDESLEHFAAKFFQGRAAKAVDQAT